MTPRMSPGSALCPGGCRQGGNIPTAPLQKGKRLNLPAWGVSQHLGRARSLPKPLVLLSEEHGQPQRAAGTCGHLGTSLQEPHLPCILSDHTGSAPVVGSHVTVLQSPHSQGQPQHHSCGPRRPRLCGYKSCPRSWTKAVPFPGLLSFHQPHLSKH